MQFFDLPGQRFPADAMQFSPDGRLLAIQAFGRVEVLDTTTGATRPIRSESHGKVGTAGVGFTADSRRVVYFNTDHHSVHRFNLDTGRDWVLRQSDEVPWSRRGDVEISAVQSDGRLVFVAVTPKARTVEIVAIDTASGEQKFSFGRRVGYLRELTISANGRWAAGCANKDLWVWEIGGRKRPSRASWHVWDPKQPCFGNLALAREGGYLAVGSYGAGMEWGRGRLQVWDLKARSELDLGSSSSAGGGGVAFAPNRPLLAFTQNSKDTGEVVFWDAQRKVELARFDWGLGALGAVAFSPDGFRCATASANKAVVWDVDV
jgi:WD40 repeat protein